MNFTPFKFPKIGIRPTIDGRLGGIRESLETSTMAMAQTLADFYTKNLLDLLWSLTLHKIFSSYLHFQIVGKMNDFLSFLSKIQCYMSS